MRVKIGKMTTYKVTILSDNSNKEVRTIECDKYNINTNTYSFINDNRVILQVPIERTIVEIYQGEPKKKKEDDLGLSF